MTKKILFLVALSAFVYLGEYTMFFEDLFHMQQCIGQTITAWQLNIIIAILLFRKK